MVSLARIQVRFSRNEAGLSAPHVAKRNQTHILDERLLRAGAAFKQCGSFVGVSGCGEQNAFGENQIRRSIGFRHARGFSAAAAASIFDFAAALPVFSIAR